MDKEEIIARAFHIFGAMERPRHFTDYQHCCECKEHDEVLLSSSPRTISRSDLGTMGWDPITFTTDDGFRYYLPGLIRIVLTEKGESNYYEQFLWHVEQTALADHRKIDFNEEERAVIWSTLSFLLNHRCDEIERECLGDSLLGAMDLWSPTECGLDSTCAPNGINTAAT